uniref:Phosphorylated adapter RNA export protein n=1 Tax=Leptobrachium leishanense TaxID=445787 RepID=A0A8C5PFU5_9ANUR
MALEAAQGMMEDEQLEDGELSDSDDDMKVAAAGDRAQQHQQKPNYRSNDTLSNDVPYRSIKSLESSDDSLSDSGDEDTSLWRRKRQKSSHPPPVNAPRPAFPSAPEQGRQMGTSGAKLNIWATVLQEQTQEAVASELGIMDMEGQINMSRQSETYNYILAKKMKEKEDLEQQLKLDKELDDYMHDDKDSGPKEENGHLKRKRPVRERLGSRLEMDYKGRYEIAEADPEDKVSDEIAYRLHEPKKDLIQRIVKIIGKKKSIELLMETIEIEQNGGLFIMNGSRRRTPGGVYLNLLKSTPSITSDQVKCGFCGASKKPDLLFTCVPDPLPCLPVCCSLPALDPWNTHKLSFRLPLLDTGPGYL